MIQLADESWVTSYLRAGGSRPIWYVKIIKSEGTTDPDGGSGAWPGTGTAQTERWFCTGPTSWTDHASLVSSGVLIDSRMNGDSISQVSFQVDAKNTPGGIASVGSFRFSLDNCDGFYKQLEDAGILFEGREVQLWLTFAGATDRTGDIQFFSGFAGDPKLKKDMIEIDVQSVESRRDAEMPPNIYEDEIYLGESLLPAGTVGKPIPLVLGSHDMVEGYLVSDVADDGASDNGRRYQFCDPSLGLAIQSISNIRIGNQGLVDACGGFADIKTASVANLPNYTPFSVDNDNGSAYFVNVADETIYARAYIRMISALKYTTDHVGVDALNAIDQDPESFVLAGALESGSTRIVACKVPPLSMPGEIEKNGDYVGVFLQHKLQVAMDVLGSMQVFLGDQADSFYGYNDRPAIPQMDATDNDTYDTWTIPQTEAEWQMQARSGVDWTAFSTLTILANKFLKYAHRNFGGDAGYFRLYETRLAVYFSLDVPETMFAEVDGFEDDASGTYTGTAGALIENPAHLVGLLLGKFGQVGDVDYSAHQAVAAQACPGWKAARNILEVQSVDEYIKELCETALLFSWVDETGAAKVFPMTAPSIMEGVDFVLKSTDVEQGLIDEPSRSPVDEVVTDFVFKFKYNPIRDEYDEQLACNPDDASDDLGADYQSLCAWAKYNAGGVGKKETFELPWVRDPDTAVEIAKKLIRWHTTRRWIISWTSDLALALPQIGDSFSIDSGWLSDYPDSLTRAVYRVTRKKINPKDSTIAFEAVQVFE